MLSQALDVAGYGVLRHLAGLGQCTPIGDAAWQSGHDRGKSAFRFGPEHDVEVVARFWHRIRADSIFVVRVNQKQSMGLYGKVCPAQIGTRSKGTMN